MPKIKTHKATAKRISMTKNKKFKHRKCGQDHFNARESGNTVRGKRRDVNTSQSIARTIRELTPYN